MLPLVLRFAFLGIYFLLELQNTSQKLVACKLQILPKKLLSLFQVHINPSSDLEL